jgi:glycylpeptide N-tetradecanoyltransferase
MKKKDVLQVHKLLTNYLKRFKLHFRYNEEEVKYWLIPRKDVIYTYVVEHIDENKNSIITDLISFYSLPSTIINNPRYNQLKVQPPSILIGCLRLLQRKYQDTNCTAHV